MKESCGQLIDLFLTLYCPESFREFFLNASSEKELRNWEETLIDYLSGLDQIVKIHLSPTLDLLCVHFTDLLGFSKR